MRRKLRISALGKAALLMALSTLLLLGLFTAAHAQSGGGYDLTWHIGGGGGTSSGGSYMVNGTLGQPDAGTQVGQVGNVPYILTGGFWSGTGLAGAPPQYYIYLPLVMRNL